MKVPIIDTPQVSTTGLPDERQTLRPDSGLEEVGQGMERLGSALEEEQKKADAARAVDATAKFTREADALLLDPTVDPATNRPKGYKLLQGENAFGARDAYSQQVQQLREKYSATLANDDQRRAFDSLTVPKTTSYLAEINAHAGNQAEQAQSEAYKIGRQTELDHVVGFADNPQARATAIENLRKLALSEGARQGGKATDQAKAADLAEADGNAAALNALVLKGNLDQATALYAQVKDRLGQHGEQAAHALETLNTQRQAATIAAQVAADSRDPQNPQRIDETAAFGKLDAQFQKTNPRLWAEARGQLTQRIADQNTAWKQVVGGHQASAMQAFMSIAPDGKPVGLPAVPLAERIWLTDTKNGKEASDVWEQLVRWDTSLQGQRRQERQLPTPDQDARALAIERDIHRNPGLYRGMPLPKLYGIMFGQGPVPGEPGAPMVAVSSRDLPHIIASMSEAAKPAAPVEIETPGAVAREEFERAFNLESRISRSWTSNQREALRRTMDETSRWVNTENAAGRKPTSDDVRKHISGPGGVLYKLDRKKILGIFPYGPSTPLQQQMDQETANPSPPGPAPEPPPPAIVPPDARQKILDVFHRRGLNPTEDQIERAYQALPKGGQ